jgi:hypothetical protein
MQVFAFMVRCLLAGSAVLGLAAAAAGAARAATLTPDRACYRESQIMKLTIAGFPPDSNPVFFGNDAPLRAQYGADGQEQSLTGDGTIGIQAPHYDVFTSGPLHLEAQGHVTDEEGNSTTTTAAADVRLVDDFHASARPRVAKPSKKVTYKVAGAVELRPVYMHVYRQPIGRNGRRTRRDFRLGTPTGPCGSLSVRMRELGSVRARRGFVYTRVIDLEPHGSDDATPTTANLAPIFVR